MPEAMTICQLGHHLGSVIVQHLVSTHLSTLGQGSLEKWTKPSTKLKVVAFLLYLAQWDFYVGQPKTKYQIFTCFSKFCAFISNQTYG